MFAQPIPLTSTAPLTHQQVRWVSLDAPFTWIKAGIDDLRYSAGRSRSLLYGALFAVTCGATTLLTLRAPWLTLVFLTGLLLLGPLLASGLYVAARQLEAGQPLSIRAALRTLASRKTNLTLFALLLVIIADAWAHLSSFLLPLPLDQGSPSLNGYLALLSGLVNPMTLISFVGIGFLFAAAVFVTCAIAIPLIIDQDRNPLEAITASAWAVTDNWPTMLVWAALIVMLSAVGILTFFIAFVVLFPVLGYATWHSYRAMLER